MTALRAAGAIAFLWLVGLGFVRAMPAVWAVPSLRWGSALGLGVGCVTLEMLVFARLGWRWSLATLVPLPTLAALLAAAWPRPAGLPGTRPPKRPEAWRRAIRLALGLLLFALVGGAVLRAALVPLSGWDPVAIWGLKARAFHVDGTVQEAFLVEPSRSYSHPDYPLHVPLLMTWIALTLGDWDDRLVLLVFPAHYAALLLVVHGALARGRSAEVALAWTAALATLPQLATHAPVALADLPLAYAVTAAAALLVLARETGARAIVVGAGAMGGLGGWTKNEGAALLVVVALCLGVRHAAAGERPRRIAGELLPFVTVGMAACLPWLIWRLALGLETQLVSAISVQRGLADAPARLVRIGAALAVEALTVSRWNLLWPLFAVATALAIAGQPRSAARWYVGVAWAGLGTYGLLYLVTSSDLAWLLLTSLDRLLLHLAPLALLAVAWAVPSRAPGGPSG